MPAARPGVPLQILKRDVPFSFWPVRPPRRGRHYALQSILFASDPWLIIKRSVDKRCTGLIKTEALAYVEQAQDFHTAAFTAQMAAARPLALYYSALNLIKAFSLTQAGATPLSQAHHGLKERLGAGQQELRDAFLLAQASPHNGAQQLYAKLHDTYALTPIPAGTQVRINIPEILPQILVGHRIWAQAVGAKERFIAVEELRFMHDEASKLIWLRLYFKRSDLTRLNLGIAKVLNNSGLGGTFTAVDSDLANHICYEELTPTSYTSYQGDVLLDVVKKVKPYIWTTISSVKPYRRFYVYVAPSVNRSAIIPQLASMYAITFYLGSITRYRPHHFDRIVQGNFGTMIQEFLVNQPQQFVYLMASEFAQQEVSRAAIA